MSCRCHTIELRMNPLLPRPIAKNGGALYAVGGPPRPQAGGRGCSWGVVSGQGRCCRLQAPLRKTSHMLQYVAIFTSHSMITNHHHSNMKRLLFIGSQNQ